MKRSSRYGERDYAFGQMMLTLRTSIGLTQAGLADLLQVSRRAVGEWEAGNSYPKADHLKAIIALAVQQRVFPSGREAEEIRSLWQASHQKMLLDELWLHKLLDNQHSPQTPVLTAVATRQEEQSSVHEQTSIESALGPRVDWGDALAVSSFYDREGETAILTHWVVRERCRVVSVLGMGGIGKSALAVTVMHQLAPHFEVVLWRSLRDTPSCETLLEACLQALAPYPRQTTDIPTSLEGRLRLLLEYLRGQHALIVLDNLETLLEEGEGMGRMRVGYEGYSHLLRQVAETEHRSCLLLTSREKPRDLVHLEGSRTPVRALRLSGLDAITSDQLLAEKEVVGLPQDRARLVEAYAGNPLALKIVTQTIVELFGGEIAPFLQQGEVLFGGVRQLLSEQFARLSTVEQTVLLWLAILREPVSIEELLSVLGTPLPRMQVLEAVESLLRRSLLEHGQRRGTFTLQSVVLEHATAQLIAEAANEIKQGKLSRLTEHTLELATVKEYVRQTQKRLLVAPLLAQVRNMYHGRTEVEKRLLWLLDQQRTRAEYAQGYGPTNLLTLLREQRGHLRGVDLSLLALRGAHLQGVEMQDAKLTGASVSETIFTESFDAAWAVASSDNGTYWAAGSSTGEVRVWREEGKTLHLAWQAHIDVVSSLAFSPDGRSLASASWDGTVKLWDMERGTLLWTSGFADSIFSLAFAPNGQMLASGGIDSIIRLWDTSSGINIQTLTGHSGPVTILTWSPDGKLLASGGFDQQIRLWEMQGAQETQRDTAARILTGHSGWVNGLTFAPDNRTLASASWDQTVKLWHVGSGNLIQTLTGHTERVNKVIWSPDGQLLASCSFDKTIWLWDVEQRSARTTLHGHTAAVFTLAFTSDSRNLLSGGEDGTMRVWEVEHGQCIHIMQGYAVTLQDVAWSPDGSQLASASTDKLVSVWDVAAQQLPKGLRGHNAKVYAVAWHPQGRLLASGSDDSTLRIWDTSVGAETQYIRDPNLVDNFLHAVAWSPDGKWIATGSYQQGVQVWDVTTGACRWVGHTDALALCRTVAWSPDGTRLATGSGDGGVWLWRSSDGTLLQHFQKHRGVVTSVAWSPNGTRLASCSGSRGNGELFVWDVRSEAHSGELLYSLNEPSPLVNALAWGPTGMSLVSGGSDGMLRWWDLLHGECVRVRKAHQGAIQSIKCSPDGRSLASCGDDGAINIWDFESGELLRTLRRDRPYERLNISGVQGLTDAQRATLRALGAIENGVVAP